MPTAGSVRYFGESLGNLAGNIRQSQERRKRQQILEDLLNKKRQVPIDTSVGKGYTEEPMFGEMEKGIMQLFKDNPEVLLPYLLPKQAAELTPKDLLMYKALGIDLSGLGAEDLGFGTKKESPPSSEWSKPYSGEIPKTSILPSGDLQADTEDRFRVKGGIKSMGTSGVNVSTTFERVPTEKERQEELETKKTEEGIKAETAIGKTEAEEVSKKFGEAGRVINAFRNLLGEFRRAEEKGYPPGTRTAWKGAIAGSKYFSPSQWKTDIEPLKSAVAQAKEVNISLLPILSGQARYVQSLAEMIGKTVPDIDNPMPVVENLVRQSVRNQITLIYGIQNGFLGAKQLRDMGINPDADVQSEQQANAVLNAIKLTPEQEKTIDDAVEYVLSVPAVKGAEEYKRPILPQGEKQLITPSGLKYKVIE